eukprot:scaffold21051_cov111-Isochrysis_galbana.AAC.2
MSSRKDFGVEGVGHEVRNRIPRLLVTEVDVDKEAIGHGDESFFRPWLKPIDDNAVHEGWEATSADLDRVSNRREAQNDVQVGHHLLNEIFPARSSRVGKAGALDSRPHAIDDVVHVLAREQTGDIAR